VVFDPPTEGIFLSAEMLLDGWVKYCWMWVSVMCINIYVRRCLWYLPRGYIDSVGMSLATLRKKW
jgi:hypothetical protein